jgi:hypothetical protein
MTLKLPSLKRNLQFISFLILVILSTFILIISLPIISIKVFIQETCNMVKNQIKILSKSNFIRSINNEL